jgi:hypothetical protein
MQSLMHIRCVTTEGIQRWVQEMSKRGQTRPFMNYDTQLCRAFTRCLKIV